MILTQPTVLPRANLLDGSAIPPSVVEPREHAAALHVDSATDFLDRDAGLSGALEQVEDRRGHSAAFRSRRFPLRFRLGPVASVSQRLAVRSIGILPTQHRLWGPGPEALRALVWQAIEDSIQVGRREVRQFHVAVGRFPEPGDEELLAGPSRNFQIFGPLDFLAEVTQHIPDPGAHLVRYYGWYSNKT